MPSLVVPFRGAEGKSRLGPLPAQGAGEARARDARATSSPRASAVGPTLRRRARGRPASPGRRTSPIPAAGQGPPSAPGSRSRLSPPASAGPLLVVNADLPCVTRTRPARARGCRPRGRARARRGRRRNDERARLRLARPLRPALRAGQRGALRGARRPSRRVDAPNLVDDVDTLADLERLARAARPVDRAASRLAALGAVGVKATVLSGGVGGARFLRGVVAVVEPARRHASSATSATTSKCSACTSRPTSTASSTRSRASPTRSGAGGGRTSPGTRSPTVADARRRVVVSARRPRSRAAPRAHAAPARGEPLSAVDRAARRGARRSAARFSPATDDPLRTFVETPAGTFAFQEWFVARGHRDEVDAVHYTGAREAEPGAGGARGDRGGRPAS